ncbi:hypothetical protein [Gluconobacter sp. OJB]|uniref:hypothetical protein n=1 Tax=Gluconobacter sp. OJB TaxID=3145196 RepID=UPI0031F74171
MKLVDTPNNKFVDQDPTTLTAGTPIPASTMNALQNEIANVVTGYGMSIDPANDGQMKQALDKNFAPLVSPGLSGIPTTSNPDGTIADQIATVDYVNQKALSATVGFTPVQQGGGADMGANKVYMGWASDASGVMVQIDNSSMGKLVFQQNDNQTTGVSQIGYNTVINQLCAEHSGNWSFYYDVSDIDGKHFVPSNISGDNKIIDNIIWTTSSLPAIQYGSSNSTAYLSTTDWTNSNFVTITNFNYNINQQVLTTSSPTFQGLWTKTISFNNGGDSTIYQDTNNSNIVIHTNNGSDHYSSFNSDGSLTVGGVANASSFVSGRDVSVGTAGTLYTNTIASYNGTTNIIATLQQQGQNVATQSWVGSQGYATTNWVNSNYVSESTYNSDFGTSDSRVFNAAYGTRIQGFTVGQVTERQFITFPQAFGAIQSVVVQCVDDNDNNIHPYSLQNNGFYVHINGGATSDITVIAFGTK